MQIPKTNKVRIIVLDGCDRMKSHKNKLDGYLAAWKKAGRPSRPLVLIPKPIYSQRYYNGPVWIIVLYSKLKADCCSETNNNYTRSMAVHIQSSNKYRYGTVISSDRNWLKHNCRTHVCVFVVTYTQTYRYSRHVDRTHHTCCSRVGRPQFTVDRIRPSWNHYSWLIGFKIKVHRQAR